MVLNKQDVYRFADFELNPSKRILLRAGERVTLAPKTLEVFCCLVQNAGRLVTKDELLRSVWPESFVEESNLTQHIFWLRKALADRATDIVTISGRGYQFTSQVHILDESSPPLLPQSRRGMSRSTITSNDAVDSPSESLVVFEETIITRRPYTRGVHLLHSRWTRGAAAAATLLLAIFAASSVLRGRQIMRGDHHEIVLAAFENSTGDAAFDRALSTLLAIDLNQSPYLVVASENDTRNVLGLMNRKPGDVLLMPVALEVCQRLNDQAVLSGAVSNFGRRYLVTLSATDCQTGKTLVQSKATADGKESVLKAIETVAADMRNRLGESLVSITPPAEKLALAHTYSLDALRAYSVGLSFRTAGRNHDAIAPLQRAIDLDPNFAAAYLLLAESYSSMAEDQHASQAMKKAYELRDQADDMLRFKIIEDYNVAVTGDERARRDNLIAWTRMYPNQPQPLLDLAASLMALGQYAEALEPARHALALAPNSPSPYEALANALLHAGAIDDALAVCNETIRRGIDTAYIHYTLTAIYFTRHDAAGMARQYAFFKGTEEEITYPSTLLLTQGKVRAALAAFQHGIGQAAEQGLPRRAERRRSVLLRREVDYNFDGQLRQQISQFDPDSQDINPILANVELGRIDAAERGVRSIIANRQSHPALDDGSLRQARAAIALARHQPRQAVAELDTPLFQTDGSVEAILLRGRACLAAHELACAEASFRFILDRPYLYSVFPFYPLSTLGLAQTFELQGNHAAARQQYEALFLLWKDADPDLPPLLKAKREYATIPRSR